MNRFLRQVSVLTQKNAKLQWRNRAATGTQVFIGVLFLLLLLVMDTAIRSSNSSNQVFSDTKYPNVISADAFVHCSHSCYDFVWCCDHNDSMVDDVVSLTKGAIGTNSTKRFHDCDTQREWLFDHPNTTLAALSFINADQWNETGSVLRYQLLYNNTRHCASLGIWGCDNPTAEIAIPLQTAVDAAFASYFSNSTQVIEASFSDFSHPDLPSNFDVVAQYGSSFLYIAVTFNYVIQLSLIVEEKELHLSEAMKQIGMGSCAYWTSWLLICTLINSMMVINLLGFGWLFGLEVFRETSFGLLVSFFWLSSMSFSSLAFLFSTLTRRTSTARLFGIGIFILTFIAAPILVPLVMNDGSESNDLTRKLLSLLPFFAFYQVFGQFVERSSGSSELGLKWDQRVANFLPSDAENANGDSLWSISDSFHSMVLSFFLFTFLAWYLDHLMPSEHGKRESFFFLFKPSFWMPQQFEPSTTASAVRITVPPSADDEDADTDVKDEAVRVRSLVDVGEKAVVVKQLTKTFAGKPVFHAVRGIEYAIDHGTAFVLLGHNGAGKSTTLNMLTGLSNISGGDAYIFGHSVVNEMHRIRPMMGVCPQHDVLYEKLTAREHLRLFAVLKGLEEENIDAEIRKLLEQTLLVDSADVPSGMFSGGMKRRLSIAIALIGDPKIIFLDEPTTGMDPVTRRDVWDMIALAKQGRVVVMTTHSMEESEALGDVVAVMSKARVQAIGTSLRLKSRFGSGYRITMLLEDESKRDEVLQFVDKFAPGTTLRSQVSGVLKFQISKDIDAGSLVSFLKQLEENKSTLYLKDFSIGLPTLEEVFLNLSNKDHFIEEEEADDVEMVEEYAFKVTSFKTQFFALLRKSITYQRKQKTSCCLILFFPIWIMTMLILIEALLFQSLRLEILCGAGILADECLEKGMNLSCIAQVFPYLSPPITPKVSVGEIQDSGRTGGINPNCNQYGCFENLEKADWMGIPLFVADESDLGQSPEMFELRSFHDWNADWQFLFDVDTCQIEYDNKFDERLLCENATQVSSCQAQVRSYQKAKTSTSNFDTSSMMNFCQANSPSSTATTNDASEYVEAANSAKQVCDLNYLGLLWGQMGQLDFSSFNETEFLQMRTGVLGSYTSEIFSTPETDDFLSLVSRLGMQWLSSANPEKLSNVRQQFNLTDADISTMKSVVRSPVVMSDLTLAPFSFILQGLLLDSFNIATTVDLYSKFEFYANHLDAIRGMSFNHTFTTGMELRELSMYKAWGGRELSSTLMKEISLLEEQQYLRRQYYSHWSSYEVHTASQGNLSYTAFFNNSGTKNRGNGNWHALILGMDNALVRNLTGHNLHVKVGVIPSAFECNRDAWLANNGTKLECNSLLPSILVRSVLDFIGISLFPYLLMIHMFIIVSILVYENEKKLRMIMKMMGLQMKVYWLVNYLFYLCQYSIMIGMMWLMGMAADVQMFTLHDSILVFLFLFSWGNLMIVFSFFLSLFFKSSRTSTAFVFLLILIVNTTGLNLLSTLTSDPNSSERAFSVMMFFPPLVMLRGMLWLGLAGAFKEAITVDNVSSYGGGTFMFCISLMWIHIVVFGFLVWYLDKVLNVGFGVSYHPLFFLQKSFWFPEERQLIESLKDIPMPSTASSATLPEDVQQEYERVVKSEPEAVIQVVRLSKKYATGKVATRNLTFQVNKKECFGLLGQNGAGKTTLLGMLTGLFPPSGGDALVGGFSILSNLTQIQSRMGVCTQFDLLWESLSGPDHLRFYGRLKGLKGAGLEREVKRLLREVNLTYAGDRPSGAYSGGMKRRLSTAISLIGNPSVVYLDEPSTGLDPASRQQLWNVLLKAKKDKSIILTTHSLEEADLLSDRIGIVADGEFQCIGTAAELKYRFGKGYSCTLTTSDRTKEGRDKIMDLIHSMFPTAILLTEPLAGVFQFEIDRKEVTLSKVFATFESVRSEYAITDWGISETTLEEVFLHLAQKASDASHEVIVENKKSSLFPKWLRGNPFKNAVAPEDSISK